MDNQVWEDYALTKEQWDDMTDEQRQAYLQVGTVPNSGEEE